MGEITASAAAARPKRDKRAVTALKARFARHNWTLVALLFVVLLIFPVLPFVEGWMVYQGSLIIVYIMAAQGVGILTGYTGLVTVGHGGFLAIGACLSALTRNQVVAFVLSISTGFLFILSGYPAVLEFADALLPDFLVGAVRQMSFLTHFNGLVRGVIDARDVVFFLSLIGVFLFANTVIVDSKKAD